MITEKQVKMVEDLVDQACTYADELYQEHRLEGNPYDTFYGTSRRGFAIRASLFNTNLHTIMVHDHRYYPLRDAKFEVQVEFLLLAPSFFKVYLSKAIDLGRDMATLEKWYPTTDIRAPKLEG